MFGFFNLRKPGGISSRDALDLIKRQLPRRTKLGHAGTLDPLATGVLVAAVGPATRLVSRVQQARKIYRGHFRWGVRSDSLDIETEIQPLPEIQPPSLDELNALIAAKFVGTIEQVPPAYSAVKVGGKRAYRLARKGREIELQPKLITVDRLEVVRYDFPQVELLIECSSGTYVRTLGSDLARAAGTDAVMTALERTQVGAFTLDASVDPRDLDVNEHLVGPALALPDSPRVPLDSCQLEQIRNGGQLELDVQPPAASEIVGVDKNGRVYCVLENAQERCWQVRLNFSGYYAADSAEGT